MSAPSRRSGGSSDEEKAPPKIRFRIGSASSQQNRRSSDYGDVLGAGPSHQSTPLFRSHTQQTRLNPGPSTNRYKLMVPLERRGYKREYQGNEVRWLPTRNRGGSPPRRRLWPQSRRNLGQINRSYRRMRPHRDNRRRRSNLGQSYGMDDDWIRSRKSVNRSRQILNRRPTDIQRERLKIHRLAKRRQWRGMEDRRTHQKSGYMTRETNIGRAKHMLRDRRNRALRGRSSGKVSERSQRRIVPTLPKHLEPIPEEDEILE